MYKPLGFLFCVLLSCFSPTTYAFIDSIHLQPSPAMAGQMVNLHVRVGVCDGITDGNDEIDLSVDGNTIEIVIDGARAFDNDWCNIPIVNRIFPLNHFSEGSYTVTVLYRYKHWLFSTVMEELAVLPLTVQGQPLPPAAVPTSGWGALALLALAVLVLAWRWKRRVIVSVASLALLAFGNPNESLANPPRNGTACT